MKKPDNNLDFMLELLMASSSVAMLKCFSNWLEKRAQATGVLFFLLNSGKTSLDLIYASNPKLVHTPSSVNINDTENPVCYSLLFAGDYPVNPVSSFPDKSSYRRLFCDSALDLGALCLPVIIAGKSYGVFVLLLSASSIKTIQMAIVSRWVLLFSQTQALFLNKEQNQRQIKQLQEATSKLSLASYKTYAQKYVDLNWIDVSKDAVRLRRNIIQASESGLNVLLIGDEGSGKKHVAMIMHNISSRAFGLLIYVDCSKFNTPSSLESELFGSKRGRRATKGDKNQLGAFERAQNGTLLLENIDSIFVSMQRKIYKVLLQKQFKAIGGDTTIAVACKVVCSQKQPLRFSNLGKTGLNFYKMAGQITLNLPGLREQPANIVPLANHFLEQYKNQYKKELQGLDDLAQQALFVNNYKKGAKELKQIIFTAADKTRFAQVIKRITINQAFAKLLSENKTAELKIKPEQELRESLKLYESKLIKQTLHDTKGNLTLAAKKLGVPRRTLTYKCIKLKIKRMP